MGRLAYVALVGAIVLIGMVAPRALAPPDARIYADLTPHAQLHHLTLRHAPTPCAPASRTADADAAEPTQLASLGAQGHAQLAEALHRARYVRAASPAAGDSGCERMHADSAEWGLALRLAAARRAATASRPATPKRERARVPPPLPPPPPPPPPRVAQRPPTAAPPCDANNEPRCLEELVRSVPVWDTFEQGDRKVSDWQAPAADATRASGGDGDWDEMGTVWSCLGQGCRRGATSGLLNARTALASMWDSWEPRLRHESANEACDPLRAKAESRLPPPVGECEAVRTSQRAKEAQATRVAHQRVSALVAEGKHAEQQEQAVLLDLVQRVLAPNTQKFEGQPCRSRCPSAGACAWCGANLCCKVGHKGSTAAGCAGRGGHENFQCTAVPHVTENATASMQLLRAIAAVEILADGADSYPSPVPVRSITEGNAEDGSVVDGDGVADNGSSKPAPSVAARSAPAAAAPAAAAAGAATATKDAASWRSLGLVEQWHGGDLEATGTLESAVAARAYKGELVVTYGDARGTAWLTNLLLSLRRVGIDHTLVISTAAPHCSALASSSARLSCAHTSWQMAGCAPPAEPRRTMWYMRHHYMVRLIALRVNTLMLDGDIVALGSPYAELHSPVYAAHNLVYSLDHRLRVDEVNIGFMYGRNCTPRGRAEWVLQETLRREAAHCAPTATEYFGDSGPFWRESDAAAESAPPHRVNGFTTAQDQKIMSDVLASSTCGRAIYRKFLPSQVKVLDRARFAARWHVQGGCSDMRVVGDTEAPHAVLRSYSSDAWPEKTEPPVERVAATSATLLSSWHGTGAGEAPGWSGAWVESPPALAHFVGGEVAGGKINLMQALGWWDYGADEVVAHVRASTDDTEIRGALPSQLLAAGSDCHTGAAATCWRGWALGAPPASAAASPRLAPRVRLVSLSGPGATPLLATAAGYLAHDTRARARLAALGALLGRISVRPDAHCDSPWATLHRRGYKGVWQTPGERWPFHGVGIAMGECSGGAMRDAEVKGAIRQKNASLCCSALFGGHVATHLGQCIASVHASFWRWRLAQGMEAAEVRLSELPRDAAGALDAPRVRLLLDNGRFGTMPALSIRIERGEELPPLGGMPTDATERASALFSGSCGAHAALFNASARSDGSDAALRNLLASVGETMTQATAQKRIGPRKGWVLRGREALGLDTIAPSDLAWEHLKAFEAAHPAAAAAAAASGDVAGEPAEPLVAGSTVR